MTYQKLIPRHIAELLRAPPEVLSCLEKGGFAVSLTGMSIYNICTCTDNNIIKMYIYIYQCSSLTTIAI